MQAMNLALFQWLGAGHSPHPELLSFARLVAEYASWLCFALLGVAAWRQPGQRGYAMGVLVAAAAASLAAHALADHFGVPRPFAIGLSRSYVEHGARGSLPSAHASVMFSAALILCLRPALRRLGLVMFALALLTGWARVYLGLHFPLDIVAGLALAMVTAALFQMLWLLARRFLAPRLTAAALERSARPELPPRPNRNGRPDRPAADSLGA
jgi:undecaprenyl-diphosphatase